MRIVIVCNDTHGGIQPYVALGSGLVLAGHQVRMVAPENFRAFILGAGLEFSGLSGNIREFLENPETAARIEKGLIATHKLMVSTMSKALADWFRECLAACLEADLIIAGLGGMIIAESVAEKLRIPLAQAHLQPLTPTSAFSGVLSPRFLRHAGGWMNRLTHFATREVFWQSMRGVVNSVRKSVLELPRAAFWGTAGRPTRSDDLALYGYSPSLLPKPRDWPGNIHVTGYWFHDAGQNWSPPESLTAFLEAGPKPVSVGFGSMSTRDAEATSRLVLEAAERAGQRVILLSGWGGLGQSQLPDWAHCVESVPHSWLFPRVSLAVHHGGAGTTGAALRAGIPSVIIPFGAGDQPFWGWLMTERKLGACPAVRRHLSAELLAGAIRETLSDGEICENSTRMGERVRSENGVGAAIELISSRFQPKATAM